MREGWWHGYDDVLPPWFRVAVGLEESAILIRAYEPQVVPGLLQTEGYIRAITVASFPAATDDFTERTVALRLARQQPLGRPDPPECWVVLDETVLRRPIGGHKVMRAQLEHLVKAAGQPKVTIQVIPFAAGWHPALYGMFNIFRFPAAQLPNIVYTEALGGTCAAYRTRVWALGPGAGGGGSDLLDDDVGVVEGSSVGGDVVWVAGEDLGGAVERGCYDDQGVDGVRLLFGGKLGLGEHGPRPLVGVKGESPGACDAAGGDAGRPLNGWRALPGLRHGAVSQVLAEGVHGLRVRSPGLSEDRADDDRPVGCRAQAVVEQLRRRLASQQRHEHPGVVDDGAGDHATPASSDPSALPRTRRTRTCSCAVRAANEGRSASGISAASARAAWLRASSAAKADVAASSRAICATAAAIMYADTSMPAASACVLIAAWTSEAVDMVNRIFGIPLS